MNFRKIENYNFDMERTETQEIEQSWKKVESISKQVFVCLNYF